MVCLLVECHGSPFLASERVPGHSPNTNVLSIHADDVQYNKLLLLYQDDSARVLYAWLWFGKAKVTEPYYAIGYE